MTKSPEELKAEQVCSGMYFYDGAIERAKVEALEGAVGYYGFMPQTRWHLFSEITKERIAALRTQLKQINPA